MSPHPPTSPSAYTHCPPYSTHFHTTLTAFQYLCSSHRPFSLPQVSSRTEVEVDITYDDGGSLSVAVYSIDDARLLRSRRIVGEYVGGGAASVQSRNAFSLPLLLSLPEAYTAIAQGIATCSTGCGMNDREALVQIRKRDRRGACEAFEKLWLKNDFRPLIIGANQCRVCG